MAQEKKRILALPRFRDEERERLAGEIGCTKAGLLRTIIPLGIADIESDLERFREEIPEEERRYRRERARARRIAHTKR